jgi:hypothetical protein
MKNVLKAAAFSFSLATAFALAGTAAGAPGDMVVNTFDKADEIQNWSAWFGDLSPSITYDRAKDADGNTNSGAMKVTVKFNQADSNDNQFSIRGALGKDGNLETATVDASKYQSLQLDLFWSTNSPVRASGDMGMLDVGLVPTDYSQIWFPSYTVRKKDGWQHIDLKIKPSTNDLSNVGGIVIKMWADDPKWGLTGAATFWVDNVKLTAKSAAVEEKPKTDTK